MTLTPDKEQSVLRLNPSGKLSTFSVITPALWVLPWFQIMAPSGCSRVKCLLQTPGLNNKEECCQSLMDSDVSRKQWDKTKQGKVGCFIIFWCFFLVVWLQIDSISLQIIVTNACFLSVSLFLSLWHTHTHKQKQSPLAVCGPKLINAAASLGSYFCPGLQCLQWNDRIS